MKKICAILAALISGMSLAQADEKSAVRVPANLQVPDGSRAVLIAHAEGSQNYVCLPANTGDSFAWTLYGPQATLFAGKNNAEQVATHFLSADSAGAGHPTWQAQDSSRVQGTLVASSTDNAFVGTDTIPWVLLKASATFPGKSGGTKLSHVSFIQRTDTQGGAAPAAGCKLVADVGAKALVPYTATYIFYAP